MNFMQKIKPMLEKALNENQLMFNEDQIQKWANYLALIQQWNKVFNLTAITDPTEMVYLHLIDSLLVSPFLYGQRMLDVGSGAGLPGIPLAIANPESAWVLLDKNSKKTKFMTQAVAELGLLNVSVVHNRTENFHPEHCFDSILSRAFGTIPMFLETTAHLLNPQGCFIAMKGKYPTEEIDAVPARFEIKAITPLTMKGMTIERHIVCVGMKC